MIENNAAIQQAQVSPNSNALNAEHYQTYEIALANDGILAGNDITQIRSYAAYARAQAQAIHKTIAATSGIEDVAAIKEEATETAQTFAKVGIYADQRIGELLRELPTKQGKRSDTTLSTTQDEVTKRQAMAQSGIPKSQAYDLQAMAANPDVVQAVLDKAEADGRIVSRKQVLDAIKQPKQAEKQRDEARQEVQDMYLQAENMELEVERLKNQLKSRPKREVVHEVLPDHIQQRLKSLEYDNKRYSDDYQKLRKRNEEMRKELDKAKDLLGMDKTMQDVRKDVQYLIAATNQYVRHYGGLTWTAASLEQVDEQTLEEFRKAAINLATFANALVTSLEGFNG